MIIETKSLVDELERDTLIYSRYSDMGVSKNGGTPKSSILIGFSIINHPFWGTTIFGNTHIHKVSDTRSEMCPVHWFILLALLSFLTCNGDVNDRAV